MKLIRKKYFQCKFCKKLVVLRGYKSFAGTGKTSKMDNESCSCRGAKNRLRELTKEQYKNEIALDRPINRGKK